MIEPAFFQDQELSRTANVFIIIAVAGAVILIFGTIMRGLVRHSREQDQIKKLLETGEPARAKILKMWDTGSTTNHNPRVGLLLEVAPENREPFQVELECLISRIKLPQIQTGNFVAVKIDRTDDKKVALDLA